MNRNRSPIYDKCCWWSRGEWGNNSAQQIMQQDKGRQDGAAVPNYYRMRWTTLEQLGYFKWANCPKRLHRRPLSRMFFFFVHFDGLHPIENLVASVGQIKEWLSRDHYLQFWLTQCSPQRMIDKSFKDVSDIALLFGEPSMRTVHFEKQMPQHYNLQPYWPISHLNVPLAWTSRLAYANWWER